MNRIHLLLLLILSALSVQAQVIPSDGVLLDSYAAVVNGKVITVGDVLASLQPAQAELASTYQGRELEEKIEQEYIKVRDALIESELILMDFEQQGGTLPDRAIENEINAIIHDQFDNDRSAFLRVLSSERLTFTEWRKQMKDRFIVRIMRQQEVSSKILVTPYDIQRAYDEMKAADFSLPEQVRMLTLTLDLGNTEEEKKESRIQANALRDRLLSGETTFEAASASTDEAEWIEVSDLNASIREAIAALESDGISEPVEMGGTLYLIQVVEHQDARILPFDEVAAEIEKKLRLAEFVRLDKIWMDTLRSKYYVQVFTHNLFS